MLALNRAKIFFKARQRLECGDSSPLFLARLAERVFSFGCRESGDKSPWRKAVTSHRTPNAGALRKV